MDSKDNESHYLLFKQLFTNPEHQEMARLEFDESMSEKEVDNYDSDDKILS